MSHHKKIQEALALVALGFSPAVKEFFSQYTMNGGRNAAHTLAWFSNFGIGMENKQGLPVVWIYPTDKEPHGHWTVREYVYDLLGRQWKRSSAPMAMDDFGTLVEVTQ